MVAIETLASSPYVLNKLDVYNQSTVRELRKAVDEAFQQPLEARTKTEDRKLTEIEMKEVEEAKQKLLDALTGFVRTIFMPIFLLLIAVSLAFNCAVLYYFTRPKVKEQFK